MKTVIDLYMYTLNGISLFIVVALSDELDLQVSGEFHYLEYLCSVNVKTVGLASLSCLSFKDLATYHKQQEISPTVAQ